MVPGGTTRDIAYRSSTLPRGSFVRSIFDNHLVRLSDRGGASQLIGAAWSEVAARALESWVDRDVPSAKPSVAGSGVRRVYRLDTMPGVASRASKVGLKNPDFLVFAANDDQELVFAVDAKFSVETARPVQVSADTTGKLFGSDQRLTDMLPETSPDARFVDGIFLSPDYVLTHEMFRHKVGHRRLTVSPDDVVLARAGARELFGALAHERILDILCEIDGLPFSMWDSLLASQYYFRLERAIAGLVVDLRKPLLGFTPAETTATDLVDRVNERRPGAGSAWRMIVSWDGEVEIIRHQRQAMHQVIGSPLSSTELRELSDTVMDAMGLDRRPSRNQVRKALGARFTAEVIKRTGVILPPVTDFPGELERAGAASREVSERYATNIVEIVTEIIRQLAGEDAKDR